MEYTPRFPWVCRGERKRMSSNQRLWSSPALRLSLSVSLSLVIIHLVTPFYVRTSPCPFGNSLTNKTHQPRQTKGGSSSRILLFGLKSLEFGHFGGQFGLQLVQIGLIVLLCRGNNSCRIAGLAIRGSPVTNLL